MNPASHSILFVCLGNICRSPAAEGVAQRHLTDNQHKPDRGNPTTRVRVDSAGTSGYHDGAPADARMRAAAETRGYDLSSKSRRVTPSDFLEFDLIVAMDRDNYRGLEQEAPPGATANLCLFSDFAGEPWPTDVPDPYYGGDQGFEEVLDMLEAGIPNLLQSLQDCSREE